MVHVDQKDDSQEGSQSIVYKQLMKCGQKQITHKSIIRFQSDSYLGPN